MDNSKIAFQLNLATATEFNFTENDLGKFGLESYATQLKISDFDVMSEDKASPLEFLGVARYTLDEFEDDTNNLFDVGASIVYRLQQTPLSFSLEYIRRFGDEGDDRFVGIADYRINNTYSVFLSYGKDFEDDFNANEDLVTLFGLQVGLGRNSAVLVENPD